MNKCFSKIRRIQWIWNKFHRISSVPFGKTDSIKSEHCEYRRSRYIMIRFQTADGKFVPLAPVCLYSHDETFYSMHWFFQTELLISGADIRIIRVLNKKPNRRSSHPLCLPPYRSATPYLTGCVIPCSRLKEGREYIKGRSIEVWVLTLWHEGVLRICPVEPRAINQPWPWPADTAENISRDRRVKEKWRKKKVKRQVERFLRRRLTYQ